MLVSGHMAETISVFDAQSPFKTFPYDRKEFYDEQIHEYKESGTPSKGCEIANVFLFTPQGDFYIQKRSADKRHNPDLLDKTVGGHIVFGDTPGYTVMVETVQEMQTPSVVIDSVDQFIKTYHLLGSYLETVAVIQYFDVQLFYLKKIIDGEEITIANKSHIFFGVYEGKTRPVDRESKGVLLYSFSEIEKEIEKSPEQFTHDFIFYFERYKSDIKNFLDLIKKP